MLVLYFNLPDLLHQVYHTFHDEVRAQKVHVWRCEGPCKDRPPFYGFVRRSMNRAPGPHDRWHPEHKANCGGVFTKVLEPPNFKSKVGFYCCFIETPDMLFPNQFVAASIKSRYFALFCTSKNVLISI